MRRSAQQVGRGRWPRRGAQRRPKRWSERHCQGGSRLLLTIARSRARLPLVWTTAYWRLCRSTRLNSATRSRQPRRSHTRATLAAPRAGPSGGLAHLPPTLVPSAPTRCPLLSPRDDKPLLRVPPRRAACWSLVTPRHRLGCTSRALWQHWALAPRRKTRQCWLLKREHKASGADWVWKVGSIAWPSIPAALRLAGCVGLCAVAIVQRSGFSGQQLQPQPAAP